MEDLWALYQQRPPDLRTVMASSTVTAPFTAAATVDMEPIRGVDLDEVEWASTRSRIVNYCKEMDVRVPSDISRDWIVDRLCQFDLAVRAPDALIQLTTAGYLLFTRKPQERIPAAKVVLRVQGQDQIVEGSLWNQLDVIINALAEFNRPFRLKGDVSETVYPYPPLALKEVIVNALVHRSYRSDHHVLIQVEPHKVQITSPGGLVDDVVRQAAGTPLQEHIKRGRRGIKGYRNPVVADLFYSAGDMDKKGSGLADVNRLITENGGQVEFGQITDNTEFKVTIYSRPEAVDEVTGTATPLIVSTKFAGNLLEVMEMPNKVWYGRTPARRVKDIWVCTDAKWLPPFIVEPPYLVSFYDMREENNPLRNHVDVETIEDRSLNDFFIGEDGQNHLVWLLNEHLYKHLEYRGLIVDRKRKRAYYPRTNAEDGRRVITYQARLRRPTRTVTKPVSSPTTQKVRYWEHESFSFLLERFGDVWTLQLLPGYVFTMNGVRHLLDGERVNKLSTKRASRDYNSQVHNDLVFWSWVLAGGEPGNFILTSVPRLKNPSELQRMSEHEQQAEATAHIIAQMVVAPTIAIKSSIPTITVSNVPAEADDEDDDFLTERDRAESVEMEEELAQIAEEQSSMKEQPAEGGQ